MTVRRRRINHNEIEKKRRDLQREQLDRLRLQIPKLRISRPSAVATITAAIEHIQLLDYRIRELETFIANRGMQVPPYAMPLEEARQFISVPIEPHTLPGERLLNVLHSRNHLSTELAPLMDPVSKTGKIVSKRSSRVTSPPSPMKKLKSVATAAATTLGVPMPLETLDPNLVAINTRSNSIRLRRDSSLLLPTNDPNTFLFGRRDSLQNFFASTMPTILDEGPKTEFRCGKCQRGVENLVMIDCDRCHTWYHIQCVGIDSNHIPLQWRCSECVGESRGGLGQH